MEEAFVRTEIDERGVAEITFYHPKRNALPSALLRQLAHQLRQADKNPAVKLVVLRSDGEGAFCAGASFDELRAIADERTGKAFFMGFAHALSAIRKLSKLVIARVHHKAVGGGVGLVCASDYAVATATASLRLSELNVGIGPFVIGPVIERKIGLSRYIHWTLEADWVSAPWALQQGIYARVLPTVAEMDDHLDAFVSHLVTKNPAALAAIKAINSQGCEHFDALMEQRAELSGRLVLSDFTKAFIARFKG